MEGTTTAAALQLLCTVMLVCAPVQALHCYQCAEIPAQMNETALAQAVSIVASLTDGGTSYSTASCRDVPQTPPPADSSAPYVCSYGYGVATPAAACANVTKAGIVLRLCALSGQQRGCRSAAGTTVCVCEDDYCNAEAASAAPPRPPVSPALTLLLLLPLMAYLGLS